MELQYEITEQDFVDYNLYFIAHDIVTQKIIRKMQFFLVGMVLIGGFLLLYAFEALHPLSVLVYGVLAAAAFFYAPIWFRQKAKKNVHRTIQNAVNRHICGQKTLRLEAEGVRLIGEGEDTLHPYQAFQRLTQAQNQIYLYLDDISALIVPNRAFSDEISKQEFVQQMQEKIQQAQPNEHQ